jgi:hypothetical protein
LRITPKNVPTLNCRDKRDASRKERNVTRNASKLLSSTGKNKRRICVSKWRFHAGPQTLLFVEGEAPNLDWTLAHDLLLLERISSSFSGQPPTPFKDVILLELKKGFPEVLIIRCVELN